MPTAARGPTIRRRSRSPATDHGPLTTDHSLSRPQIQPTIKHIRHPPLYNSLNSLRRIPRAEMSCDNQLVFESSAPLDQIVQVNVPEFVDFFLSVRWRNKR